MILYTIYNHLAILNISNILFLCIFAIQSLIVAEIPEFMANLSSVTAQNSINITQSSATVQAIVDILFKIANLSQTTVINKPVMEVCIFTF